MSPPIIVGVVSDTHGLLRPEVLPELQGVDHIIHAGDVGRREILDTLRGIAPVTVVRGNVDVDPWAASLPMTDTVELDGRLIHVLHDLNHLDLTPRAAGIAVVVSGHSHRPVSKERQGVLYLNPGSIGPRRFSLPVSMARLVLDSGSVRAELLELEV